MAAKKRKLTEARLHTEIDKLLVQFAGKNLDGRPHINVTLVDRRTHDPLHFMPVPMTHRPLYYKPELGDTMTEGDWFDAQRTAIYNVQVAADALDRIQKCFEHWRREKKPAKPSAV